MISVLMPAFNAEKYVSEAIKSILGQTFDNFEFIILDDGSTDATWEIIQKYARMDGRIIPLQNRQNVGICASLNRGIKQAGGRYIARMDADDWSYPKRLQLQIELMESNPQVVICGGEIEVCDKNLKTLNKRAYPIKDKEIRERFFRLNPFAHPAIIYQRQAVVKAGGYNSALAGVEDYDLYFRLGRLGKLANLPQTVLKLRTHPSSVSSQTISRQAKLNLYVRVKAVEEYGYQMNWQDQVFFLINLLTIKLIPDRFKFSLYNKLRIYKGPSLVNGGKSL